jgi:hypothetical protein
MLAFSALPTHAAVLVSQTDDTGTPVLLGLNQQLDDPATLSFVAPHAYAPDSALYVKLKGSISDPNYPLGNWTSMRLSDDPYSGGAHGYTDYAGAGGLGYGCMNPSGTTAPDQLWTCPIHLSSGISAGARIYTIIEENNWTYYMHFISDTSASGAPYMVLTDTPMNPFYAQVSDAPDGSATLYQNPNTESLPLKKLPNDWVVQVSTTTNSAGNAVIAGGYQWYQVTDPTDDVSGWMQGADSSTTVEYLPYNGASTQESLEASSTDEFTTPASRAIEIVEAVEHYYNDTSTSSSLYSSDDVPGYEISRLKSAGLGSAGIALSGGNEEESYPETLVLGIIAQESGDVYPNDAFDNENITSDFGHGIMQITFSPSDFDNRGLASGVVLPQCNSQNSALYMNCYSNSDATSPHYRHYIEDAIASVAGSAPLTFKQYANTAQSIYANIKDGMGLLSQKYAAYSQVNSSVTVDGVMYSPSDIRDILATENYNGGDSACGYVNNVATKLDTIGNYFPNATTSNISDLVEKMHDAGKNMICAQLHSPGNISISDSAGNVAGVVNGQTVNTFPLSVYDADTKSVEIMGAQAESSTTYHYQVVGTASATYSLNVTIKNGDQSSAFQATDIPTTSGQVQTYTIDEAALAAGSSTAVTVQIDPTGAGVGVTTIQAGSTITGSEFSQEITQSAGTATTTTADTDSDTTASSTSESTSTPPSTQSTDQSTSTPPVTTSTSTSECVAPAQQHDFAWYLTHLNFTYL